MLYSLEVDHILSGSKNTFEFVFCAYYKFVEISLTSTSRDEVSANNVFLQTFQTVYFTIDSSFVQHLRSFLEGCSRHKAVSLQCSTGDTLKNLVRSSRN